MERGMLDAFPIEAAMPHEAAVLSRHHRAFEMHGDALIVHPAKPQPGFRPRLLQARHAGAHEGRGRWIENLPPQHVGEEPELKQQYQGQQQQQPAP